MFVLILGLVACGNQRPDPRGTVQAAETSTETTPPDTASDTSPHHPEGYAAPAVHGAAAVIQEEACVDCHGGDLTGDGAAVSCDNCHEEGWRTDCTRCHGGEDNQTGAPPAPVFKNSSFETHSWHVEENSNPAYGCEQCHTTPADVLSAGHLFVGDSTPGAAEVDFSGGLSPEGTYLGGGSCTNLYCHGSGLENSGEVSDADGPLSCDTCHPFRDSGSAAWSTMSGDHTFHVAYNPNCGHCHNNVNDRNNAMPDPSLHVDGRIDRVSAHAMTIEEDNTCSGECHGAIHDKHQWYTEKE